MVNTPCGQIIQENYGWKEKFFDHKSDHLNIIFLLMCEHIYFLACYSLISNYSASKIFTLLLHLNYYVKTIFEILSYKLFTPL